MREGPKIVNSSHSFVKTELIICEIGPNLSASIHQCAHTRISAGANKPDARIEFIWRYRHSGSNGTENSLKVHS